MRHIFEASGRDFNTAEEAIAHTEKAGQGSVVKFMCASSGPISVLNSVGLWSYSEGEWWKHTIYDGIGEKPC